MLTREQILAAVVRSRPVSSVSIEEWGEIGMRPLSGSEMSDVYRKLDGVMDGARFVGLVAIMSLCDDAGARIYGIDEADEQWRQFPMPVCEALALKSSEINRLGVEARADAKKESIPSQSGETGTESP